MAVETLKEWEVTLRLLSPLQIGAGTLGFVEKTELFVPPRVMWGAFVNTLVRLSFNPAKADHFKEVGATLRGDDISRRFSPFFLSPDGMQVCTPRFDKGERKWELRAGAYDGAKPAIETLTEAILRSRFVRGLSGQATDSDRMATSKNTLHETDLIQPLFRKEGVGRWTAESVFLCGYLRLPEKAGDVPLDTDTITRVLDRMRIGGGRKRGWGLVACKKLVKATDPHENLAYREEDAKTVLLSGDTKVEAGQAVDGRAYLAVFREHGNTKDHKGSGRSFTAGVLCWEAGSVVRMKEGPDA